MLLGDNYLLLTEMNRKSEKTGPVALVESFWTGHHPTYFTQFAIGLSEAGAEVLPICPRPDDFARRLATADVSESVRSRILAVQGIHAPTWSGRLLPGKLAEKANALSVFGQLGRQLRQWEKVNFRKIDQVFFACIYDSQFEHFRFAERAFGFPWSGLYLHARSFRMPGSKVPYWGGTPNPELLFSSPRLRALGLLDEGAESWLQRIAAGRPVVAFPDITDKHSPPAGSEDWALSAKMLKMAAGRPVVSLTGHLQWTKGLEEFTALAASPEMQGVFFFLGGELNTAQINPEKLRWMQGLWEKADNIYAHLQQMPERTMNAIVKSTDVLFAAYRSFPNSSNVLTKAATFAVPVVVNDNYLMAERVRAYQMGEVVEEGDLPDLRVTLARMLAPGYRANLDRRARWAEYAAFHDSSRLRECFERILADDASSARMPSRRRLVGISAKSARSASTSARAKRQRSAPELQRIFANQPACPSSVISYGGAALSDRGVEAALRGAVAALSCTVPDTAALRITHAFHDIPETSEDRSAPEHDDRVQHVVVPTLCPRFTESWPDALAAAAPAASLLEAFRDLGSRSMKPCCALQFAADSYTGKFGIPSHLISLTEWLVAQGMPVVLWGGAIDSLTDAPALESRMMRHLRSLTGIFATESVTYNYLVAEHRLKNVNLFADSAFLVEEREPTEASARAKIKDTPLAFNMSPLINACATTTRKMPWETKAGDLVPRIRKCADIISALRKDTGLPILLLPHAQSALPGIDDYMFLRGVHRACKDAGVPDVEIADEPLGAAEIKWLAARCRMVIASRIHAAIAGFSSGIPTISLGESRTAVGVNRDVFGTDDYLVVEREIEPGKVVERARRVLEREADLRSTLLRRAEELKKSAAAAGHKLQEILAAQG
jgi:colanic acid/amylovoran biosynthesis protein